MRRSRIWLYLLLIVVIIIGAAVVFLGRGVLLAPQATATPAVRYVSILTVAQPIQRGSEITAEALSVMEIPEDKLTSVMITDPTVVVGRLAKYPLEAGVLLTTAMLANSASEVAQTGSEAATMIEPGMSAISIPISRLSAVAYGIRDGDRVDVILTMLFTDVDPTYQSALPNTTAVIKGTGFLEKQLPTLTTNVNPGGPQGRVEVDPALNQAFYVIPSEAQRPRMVSQRILQNVQVLKIGTFSLTDTIVATPVPAAPGQPTPTPAPVQIERPDIITLIVPPQDAVTLTYLIYSGAQLTLTLRGIDDQTRVETEAATLQFLLSQYAIPVPAKLPYAVEPRIDQIPVWVGPNDAITQTAR